MRWPDPSRTLTISAPFRGEPIRLRVSGRTAGAVDGLTWRGRQYVNAYDHGREFQSAAFLDPPGECENPTEAGSAADGTGETSTSLLLSLQAGPDWLETRSRMAQWVGAGQRLPGCEAGRASSGALSTTGFAKRVEIGAHGIPNAIRVETTFEIASTHPVSTFEALTVYTPPEFSRFWTVDAATGEVRPLGDGPGEGTSPVALSTADGAHALALWSPGLPQPGQAGGYGRWRFDALPGPGNATNKLNCVYREADVKPGPYRYTCYAVIGTLEDVRAGLVGLAGRVGAAAR